MKDNRAEIETMETDLARRNAQLMLEALTICNQEYNKLTTFQRTPDYWINEAINKI